MLRINTYLIVLLWAISGFGPFNFLSSQPNAALAKLNDLPLEFSWNNSGIRLRTKILDPSSNQFFNVAPDAILEKIGNDILQVNISNENKPVIIDLSGLFVKNDYLANNGGLIDDSIAQIDIEVPKIGLSSYEEAHSYVLEVSNFSNSEKWAKQTFIFRGLDVLFVVADERAEMETNGRKIKIDVHKSKTNYLLLKGGQFGTLETDKKVPELCRKYNGRFFVGKEAFVCIEDCKDDDPNAEIHLKHIRNLITKYNITDFNDAPVSYLGDILLTKKGIGINLKEISYTKGFLSNKIKKATISELDSYHFFPWYEFIHLEFEKFQGENKLMVHYPYAADFVYDGEVAFTNVELIQFFNELKMIIAKNL